MEKDKRYYGYTVGTRYKRLDENKDLLNEARSDEFAKEALRFAKEVSKTPKKLIADMAESFEQDDSRLFKNMMEVMKNWADDLPEIRKNQ
jgi:hypothetical protein